MKKLAIIFALILPALASSAPLRERPFEINGQWFAVDETLFISERDGDVQIFCHGHLWASGRYDGKRLHVKYAPYGEYSTVMYVGDRGMLIGYWGRSPLIEDGAWTWDGAGRHGQWAEWRR